MEFELLSVAWEAALVMADPLRLTYLIGGVLIGLALGVIPGLGGIVGMTSDRSNIQITKAVIPIETASGKITRVRSGGRRVSWAGGGKKGKLRVSGRRTKITLAGKEAKRKVLEVGMACKFTYQGSSAKKIDC